MHLFFFPFVFPGDVEVWLPGGAVQSGYRAVALGDGPRTGQEDVGDQYQL